MSLERSLAEIVSHRMQAGEPLPVSLALAILRQVCDNLDYAHTMRDPAGQPLWITHRDISPVHIIVADTGQTRLNASQTPHGNPAYFAPEFVANAVFDQRSDLFALGVVAYEMLANRPLFHSADPRETFAMICSVAIPPPSTFNPHVPPDLDNIILMALGRDPAYRWQSAAMFREGLRSVAERFNLETIGANEWVDLLTGRIVPQSPPPPPAPPLEPALVRPPPSPVLLGPPDDPPSRPLSMPDPSPVPNSEWADDTNNETRVASAALPKSYVPPGQPVPAPPPLDDIVTFKPSAPKPPAPPAAEPEPRRPIVRTASEADFLATLEPEEGGPKPQAFEGMDLPRPNGFEAPVEPMRNPGGFELEIPEMTQIGAKPLISDEGTQPLQSLVGERIAPRATRPSLPPPVMMSLPQVETSLEKPSKKKWILIAAGAAVVVAAVVVLIVVLGGD